MRTPEARVARPFLVLCVALVCQLFAGMLYWWPALVPGLQSALSLSNPAATALVATANSGSVLGILGGLFHDRFGSRKTAICGSAGISLCFLSFALVVTFPLPPVVQPFVLWLCLLITLAIANFSYMLYSSCITAAVSVFRKSYRGRVVGLSAAMYGASAGVFGALQAALFPSVTQTAQLLFFFSAFCLVPVLLAAGTFPDLETYAVENVSAPLLGYSAVQPEDTRAQTERRSDGAVNEHISVRVGVAYCIAWALVITLQISAVSEALELSRFLQKSCAAMILLAILCFFFLPVRSPLVVKEQQTTETGHVPTDPEPPFSEVVRDWRYIYLCFCFFAIVGGGAIAVLVQAPRLAASRMYQGAAAAAMYDPEAINRVVRSYVVVFSACNMTARLFIGGIMDWGDNAFERLMWKYDIMLYDTLVISAAMLGIAFANSRALFVAVALVGFSHGTWCVSTPALTTLWFGVQSFPRNFALVGPFVAVGSATLASTVPSFLASKFGKWTTLLVMGGHPDELQHVCSGLMCSIPTFCLLGGI